MGRRLIVAAFILTAILMISIAVFVWSSSIPKANSDSAATYSYKIIRTYPHDNTAFTEGLIYENGSIYESLGGYGSSALRCEDLETGSVLKEISLSPQFFGEGLAAVNASLIQLTWKEKTGFVYDAPSLVPVSNFSYPTDGWGLTFNGNNLIMSDGSSNLYFLNPDTYQRVGQIRVTDGNNPITNINELEYINGSVYANIWQQDKIAIINPQNGQVRAWIDFSGLTQINNPKNNPDNVLNGIAYNKINGNIYVTGKDWPNLYQVEIEPQK